MLTSPMPGNTSTINTLSQIGISFGAIGSAPGSTNDLVVDTTKLTAAIQSSPTTVASLFSALSTQATIQAGGAGNVTGLTGSLYTKTFRSPGTYVLNTAVNGDGTANITATFTPIGGGNPLTSTAFNVAPGSSSNTLIAGLTLQFGASFTAGSDTLNVTTPSAGIEAQLEQYLTPMTGVTGSLANQQTGYSSIIANLTSQITDMNTQVAAYKTMLITKFTAMEVALQSLQQSSSELTASGFTGSLTVGTGNSQVSFG
jgi:flagellar hook-associated protein 2